MSKYIIINMQFSQASEQEQTLKQGVGMEFVNIFLNFWRKYGSCWKTIQQNSQKKIVFSHSYSYMGCIS